MVWMMDTYMNVVGFTDKNANRRVVTGKTVNSGGSLGRETATGQGIVHCIAEWARDRRFDLNGATYMVQGFGNVGSNAAKILARTGASLVAVGDWKGYIANADGINPLQAQRVRPEDRLGRRLPRRPEVITRARSSSPRPPTSSSRRRSSWRSASTRPRPST